MTTSSRRRSASRGYAPCSTRDSGASGSWVDLGLISWSVSRVLELTQTHFHMHTDSHGVMAFTRVRPAPSGGFEPYRYDTGGSRDTHGDTGHTGQGQRGHTRDTRAHKGTRTTQTNLTTIQTHQQHTSRTSARRPKPRPTQQPQARSRPLPAAAQYMYRRTVYIWDACEVRLCDTCARVRPCVPCVSRVKRNRGGRDTFYRYIQQTMRG
jgi:hypothetical protein